MSGRAGYSSAVRYCHTFLACALKFTSLALLSRLLQIEICSCPEMDEATSPSETLPCAARLAALGYRFEEGKLRHVITGEGALKLPCWPVAHQGAQTLPWRRRHASKRFHVPVASAPIRGAI